MNVVMLLGTVFLLTSCGDAQVGDVGNRCNSDGTCNSPNLECRAVRASTVFECVPKGHRGCQSRSECFCNSCAEQCGKKGVERCVYTDTSVWGAQPTVCECKQ